MNEPRGIPVAVVGGGPVGMLLALFLDRHGIESVLFNTETSVPAELRGNTHNARTMEHYRTLGIAPAVRRLGLPWQHGTGITFHTHYAGHELCHLPWPAPGEALRRVAGADATDQTPEPMHRANQRFVEELLLDQVRTRPRITVRFGHHVTALAEREDHVLVETEGESWRAGYVVGCDGGRSTVRQHMGVRYTGEGGLQQDVLGRRATAAHLRVPGLYRDVLRERREWSHWAFNADLALNLISINGDDEFFLLTSSVDADRTDERELARLVRRAAGLPLGVEVIGHRPWTPGAALVAERFVLGRFLLAGDAAHLFTPNGGFGMNTGVDDTANLAWKLAAAVRGWGGPGLLASYETERRAIALRNTNAARGLNIGLGAIDRPAALTDDSADGREARAKAGEQLTRYGLRTMDTLGVQLGARYDDSPVIASDGSVPPPDSFTGYTPSAVPGGRLPHVWLDEHHGPGGSIYDRLGAGFTLVDLSTDPCRVRSLSLTARARGIPLTVLRLAGDVYHDLYQRDLVLVRPDRHVAWRGNTVPEDPDVLWGRLTDR